MRAPALAFARALAFAFACAACGGPRSSRPASEDLVRVGELPEESRALLAAYGRGGDAWEAARDQALADPDATRFLVENLMLEMMRSWDAFAARSDERARAAYARAEFELVRIGAPAAAPLVELASVSDGIVAELASRTLSRLGRCALEPAESMLTADESAVRRRGAALFGGLPHAGAREPLLRDGLGELALRDPEWIVRAEAAHSLGVRGARDVETAPWRALLERALVDPDAAVRRSAADGLAELGDPRAIPALANALARGVDQGEVRLVDVVQATLARLSGDAHSRTPDEWLAWWRTERQRRK